jgi:hypothetical protein
MRPKELSAERKAAEVVDFEAVKRAGVNQPPKKNGEDGLGAMEADGRNLHEENRGFVNETLKSFQGKERIPSLWLQLESIIPAVRLLRYLAMLDREERESLISKLNLDAECKSWIKSQVGFCVLFFERDLKALVRVIDHLKYGFKNRLVDLGAGAYLKSSKRPLLRILLEFEDEERIESIDEPGNVLSFAGALLDAVKDFLAEYGCDLKQQEQLGLKKTYNSLKASIALGEKWLDGKAETN